MAGSHGDGHGRAFALYVMLYTLGRGWIEMLRIDTVNHIGPFRLNVWTSIIVFTAAAIYFIVVTRRNYHRDGYTVAPTDYRRLTVLARPRKAS